MRAWLVLWEWASEAASVVDRIAAILPPRLSNRSVAEHVELLYVIATSSVSELAAYAKHPKHNPYPAKIDMTGHVICGHHPWLRAQPVKDLKITREGDWGAETVTWHTLPIWRAGETGERHPL